MKKFIFASIIGLCVCGSVTAQNYRDSRYYNSNTGRLDYRNGTGSYNNGGARYSSGRSHNYGNSDTYVGLRIGPTFSHVSSDDPYLDGGSAKTGLNVGVAFGTRIVYNAPLYFESGLYYTEKGGKGNGGTDDGRFTYNLDYLEVPLILKYKYSVDDHFRIEPYFGGYFAVGVAGKIKDFNDRQAYSSFSNDDSASFQRCDGGLKFGVGASYDMFYMELGYDLGLSNICHDYFETSHNGALQLNFGVNF